MLSKVVTAPNSSNIAATAATVGSDSNIRPRYHKSDRGHTSTGTAVGD